VRRSTVSVQGMRDELEHIPEETFGALEHLLDSTVAELKREAFGTVSYVGEDIIRATGFNRARSEEIVLIRGDVLGIVFSSSLEETGIVLMDHGTGIKAGEEVRHTGRVLDVPVGKSLIGRVVDALGRPRDGKPPPRTSGRKPIERDAPGIMDRAPVEIPLQTGIKIIDALIPIGRGQRELILGDRQTGKTAIAIDTVLNQQDSGVLCVYCFIGKEASEAAKQISDLAERGAMDYTVVVIATGDDTPGLQYASPYAAMSIGEEFRDAGQDVLIVFDDLTRHAWAYRQISLLLRRPPGREAYPGDIFFIHSRLLERATRLSAERGGGSITALPIVETEAQNISAYIPTNLISITDGQIYTSPELFRKGILPAIDAGRSVSRVGGKAQLSAYRKLAGDLKLSYAQFTELETFARFGATLEENTRRTIEHGRRIREIFKQDRHRPLSVYDQIIVLLAASAGIFDGIAPDRVREAEDRIRKSVSEELPEIGEKIRAGRMLIEEDRDRILRHASEVLKNSKEGRDRA